MSGEWRPAPEVGEIARQLITRVAQHQALVHAHIEYVFIKETPKSRGREIWGRARRISGLQAWLSNPNELPHLKAGFVSGSDYFLIEISHEAWLTISDTQRVALVDHELSHCAFEFDDDGLPKLAMRHHDVEEFIGVVNRHGLWKADVEHLGIAAAEQLALNIDQVVEHANSGATS